MSQSKFSSGWDDTIRPAKSYSLSHNFNTLSSSPENKRKRRHEDPPQPAAPSAPFSHSSASSPQLFGLSNQHPSSSPQQAQIPPHHAQPPSSKRSRVSQTSSRRSPCTSTTRRRLEALDSQQLMALLEELVDRQPQLCDAIDNLAPPVTPARALEVLKRYLRDVEESSPYGGGRSDYAFLRIRPQWTSFFVASADYTNFFLESTEIDTTKTLDFLDGATSLVHAAPEWESPENNASSVRAYFELGQAWSSVLTKAQEASSYMFMSGSTWEARFHNHCRRSQGRMVDGRSPELEKPMVMRIPEGVTS